MARRLAIGQFPIELVVHYRLTSQTPRRTGTERTRAIGSRAVSFTCAQQLPPGATIALLIEWPVKLNGTVALTLVIAGTILPSDPGVAFVRVDHYEFRTR